MSLRTEGSGQANPRFPLFSQGTSPLPRVINFAVIGCGLMGREFASAAARWCHLQDLDYQPRIVAVCDPVAPARAWFERNVPSVTFSTGDYKELLRRDDVEAIYCAIPHNLHAELYVDIVRAGKHLLGEKPFGIDLEANGSIMRVIAEHPGVLVRCSSEMPFYPGAYLIGKWVREQRFGRIIEVEAGLLHSSDLNPDKPINWKRRVATNGAYGCLGDLGMHAAHLPLRAGWLPRYVTASLTKVVDTRPDGKGGRVPCETWDNGTLTCAVAHERGEFPMFLHMKRIAPGHANTWFMRVTGTDFSAEYSTKYPKQIATMPYKPGGAQAWCVEDVAHASAYPVITGGIFEFGFPDVMLQMWAAFCDELVHRGNMSQPFHCATPDEAAQSHRLFTAALRSQRERRMVEIDWAASA